MLLWLMLPDVLRFSRYQQMESIRLDLNARGYIYPTVKVVEFCHRNT